MSSTSRSIRLALSAGAFTASIVVVTIPASAAPTAARAVSLSELPSVVPHGFGSLQRLGAVAATAPVSFSVLVRGKNDAALATVAKAVSDPSSPDFRNFLTRSQIRSEFDPAPATTERVESGLRALGITITRVSSDGRLIDATAPAGALTSRLGVHFANVRSPQGVVARVATSEPALPAGIRPLVSDIIGLTATPVHTDASGPVTITNAPAPAYFNGRPCSSYFGQQKATNLPTYGNKARPFVICGYTPKQIRAAYRVPQTKLTGKGARIAIVDDYDSATIESDTNRYAKAYGLPGFAKGQFTDHTDALARHTPEIVVNDPTGLLGPVPGESPQEWSGEQTLDVEMVHQMAPKAKIDYYGGDQGLGLQPLEAEFAQVVADDKVQFISDSWGLYEKDILLTPADPKLMSSLLETGAAEGIGAAFSTGDDGDNIEMNDVKSADFPASTDLATAVGGTTLVVGKNRKYVGETYWGTRLEPLTADKTTWDGRKKSGGQGPATGPGSLAGAAGGGVSSLFAEPSWQKGVVPAALTTQSYTSPDGANTNNVSKPGRVVPDISLVGDSTTGVLVGQTQTDADGKARYSLFRIGGTSVSCPLFAGMIALAIQANHGKSLGFVSPALYAAYKHSKTGFRDPRLGSKLVNIRTDYNQTQDPKSGVVYHLRLLGQVGSLRNLKGYDDSTGLGTPCGPTFTAAVVKPKKRAATSRSCRK